MLSIINVFRFTLIPQHRYFLLVREIALYLFEKLVITQFDSCRWFYAPIYAKWLRLTWKAWPDDCKSMKLTIALAYMCWFYLILLVKILRTFADAWGLSGILFLTTLVKNQRFRLKLSWKPPLGHPNLEIFLSQVENELFEITKEPTLYSNLSQDGWRAIRALANDRSIVIKKADKGSCIVVWDRTDYLREAEKQLSDKNV